MWCSDRRGVLRRASLLVPAAALAACGFQPLYGEGSPARAVAGRVEIAPLDGEAGFALRARLTERLGPAVEPTHRLEVDLALDREGVATTRENITTRFAVEGAARYRLVPLAGGPPALEETVRAVAGYSAPANETASAFAIRAAEQDAVLRVSRALADRILLRLSVTAGDWAPDGTP